MKTVKDVLPNLIFLIILFIIGSSVEGMWQPIALIIFYVALGQAFNIFLGLTGYVDFGYVAFLGLGAYGMALAIQNFAHLGLISIAIGVVAGAIFAAILSLAVGGVALRLRGAYFAIATIGVNEGFRFFIEGTRLWGGTEGIVLSGFMRKTFGSETTNLLSTYVSDVALFFVAFISALITSIYLRSRIGYALLAMREDEDVAKVMGINVTKYKILAFITSAIFAGVIGALAWTLKLTYVFPEDVFNIVYTVEAIVIVMLGGAGTLLGPLVGGTFYALLKYYLNVVFPGVQLLILAPILIAVVVLFPEGLVGYLKKKVRGTKLEEFVR